MLTDISYNHSRGFPSVLEFRLTPTKIKQEIKNHNVQNKQSPKRTATQTGTLFRPKDKYGGYKLIKKVRGSKMNSTNTKVVF